MRPPCSPGTPPGRPHKRRRHNRRPEASQGRPPTPPGEDGELYSPASLPPRRASAEPPRGCPTAPAERGRGPRGCGGRPPRGGRPQLRRPRRPDPAPGDGRVREGPPSVGRGDRGGGRGDPPSGLEDAPTSGPPSGAPDPPSLNRGDPPPGREDTSVDCPAPETLGSTSEVDSHPPPPPEAMETSVVGDPPVGVAGAPSPPVEELVGIDSNMHLDCCFSRRHGFGCIGRTLSDLRQHVIHLTGEEPPRLHAVIANFCDERQWPMADLAVQDPAVYHTISLHPRAAGLVDVRDLTLGRMRERLAHPQCVALGEVGIDFIHQGHVNPP